MAKQKKLENELYESFRIAATSNGMRQVPKEPLYTDVAFSLERLIERAVEHDSGKAIITDFLGSILFGKVIEKNLAPYKRNPQALTWALRIAMNAACDENSPTTAYRVMTKLGRPEIAKTVNKFNATCFRRSRRLVGTIASEFLGHSATRAAVEATQRGNLTNHYAVRRALEDVAEVTKDSTLFKRAAGLTHKYESSSLPEAMQTVRDAVKRVKRTKNFDYLKRVISSLDQKLVYSRAGAIKDVLHGWYMEAVHETALLGHPNTVLNVARGASTLQGMALVYYLSTVADVAKETRSVKAVSAVVNMAHQYRNRQKVIPVVMGALDAILKRKKRASAIIRSAEALGQKDVVHVAFGNRGDRLYEAMCAITKAARRDPSSVPKETQKYLPAA